MRVWIIYHASRILPLNRRNRIRRSMAVDAAREIADFFQAKAGVFIKAAQFVRNISNLFQEEIADQFARVEDTVEPEDFKEVRHRFLTEFGQEPEELFAEFDREAIAAASIGQVHTARLTDGRKVVVKFLHDGLENQTRYDINALRLANKMIRWTFPHLDLTHHLREFTHMISAEMDFLHEAENLRLFRANFAGDEQIIFPDVISNRSGRTVITIEYIAGIPISDAQALEEAGVNRRELIELLMNAYIRMVFEHQFFHADPHPGNLFVLPPDGLHPLRLGFYDFGAAETVTTTIMRHVQMFMYIIRARNIPQLADLAAEAGFLRPTAELEPFRELFEIIYARYGGFQTADYREINPQRLGRALTFRDIAMVGLRMRDLVRELHLPRRYLYLARSFTYIISVAQGLDKEVNLFQMAKPMVDRYIAPTPKRARDLFKRKTWQGAYEKIITGLYGINLERRAPAEAQNKMNLIYSLGHQIMFATLSVTGCFFSAWLYFQGEIRLATYTLAWPAVTTIMMFFSIMRSRHYR